LPTDTQFTTNWLEERNRFDKAARNPIVEDAFLRYAEQFQPLNLIDIGAGNGAVFTHLAQKLPPEQNWTLVELNPDLLENARQRLLLWANAHGYTIEKEESDHLLFVNGERQLSIQLRHGSFLELDQLLPLDAYHAVTASAVIDLLSREMLSNLLQQLQRNELAFYPTLNYRSMDYIPAEGDDEHMIEAYERHMQREQDFGQALGSACTAAFQGLAKDIYGKTAVEGSSPWVIRPTDVEMHKHMLSFQQNSLPLMLSKAKVSPWIARKKQLLAAGKLHLTVEHSDLFLHPMHA
jgi:hypothetical protein